MLKTTTTVHVDGRVWSVGACFGNLYFSTGKHGGDGYRIFNRRGAGPNDVVVPLADLIQPAKWKQQQEKKRVGLF